MGKVYSFLGGRKMVLVLAVMALIAARKLLGLDDQTVHVLLWLALGGSGAIALEDGLKARKTAKK